jgi:phosphoglycolate phosphatase
MQQQDRNHTRAMTRPLPELLREVRIISFDLDGTLIDTAPDLVSAVNLMLTLLGTRTLADAQVLGLIGNGVEQLVARALQESLGSPPRPEILNSASTLFGQLYGQRLFDRSVVYPGVPEALRQLAALGLVICCITNKPSRFALPLLDRAGLGQHLSMTHCADNPDDRKPAANLLLAACSTAGLRPEQLLHVGDSHVDIAAARAAGAAVVAVDYGYGQRTTLENAGPDALVADLGTLVNAAKLALTNATGFP